MVCPGLGRREFLKPVQFHFRTFLKQPGPRRRIWLSILNVTKGHFPFLLGTHPYGRSHSAGSQEDFNLVHPTCTSTPQESGAFSEWPRMTLRAAQSPLPLHSQSSVRNQERFQSRTVSFQSLCSSSVVRCPPCTPPSSKGTSPSHHSSQWPHKQQGQATLTQA